MIFDQLKNAKLYFSFGERFQKAFEYLANTDFNSLEPGKYEIEGDNIYAIIQEYDTKPITAGKWEAHKKFADIQYIISGKEKMGYSHSNKMIVTQEYNHEKDVLYLKGNGNFLIAEPGYFTLFFPSDIHMPCIALNISTGVKKVVIKVKVDSADETITEPIVEQPEKIIEDTQPSEEINNKTE